MSADATAAQPFDLLTVGRVSVDLYPQQVGGFEGPQTFQKSVGGSPTNVAVAAARLGRRVAAVTGVGGDRFGDYVRDRLSAHGVDVRFIHREPKAQTPLALVALDPPTTPQVAFYRTDPTADAALPVDLLDQHTITHARALWVSHAALAAQVTGESLKTWLRHRQRARFTLLDLDYRPALWPDLETARRSARTAIGTCDVVIGNQQECEMALGQDDPDRAADALLADGVHLAVVKMGPDGVLMATPNDRVRVPSRAVEVVCGLGAGDAFGGALVHGLLETNGELTADVLRRIATIACDAGAFVTGRLTCSDDMPTLGDLRTVEV